MRDVGLLVEVLRDFGFGLAVLLMLYLRAYVLYNLQFRAWRLRVQGLGLKGLSIIGLWSATAPSLKRFNTGLL